MVMRQGSRDVMVKGLNNYYQDLNVNTEWQACWPEYILLATFKLSDCPELLQ